SSRVRCWSLPFSDECGTSPPKRKCCKPAWSYASHVAPAARSLASSQHAKDVSWAAASILSHRGRRGRRSTGPGAEFVVARALADAVVQVIVQDDEIAHVLVLGRGRLVELRAPVVAVAVVREQQNQALNVGLNQVDGRGFERLQEAARQAEANHVVAPELASTAGDEADGAGVGEGPRIEIRHQ